MLTSVWRKVAIRLLRDAEPADARELRTALSQETTTDAMETAEKVAEALNRKDERVSARNYKARTWQGGRKTRVYVMDSDGSDIGYIEISEDGARDYGQIRRGKADVRNRVESAL